jgi:hypothetical protein
MWPCSFTDGVWCGFRLKRAALEITGGGTVYCGCKAEDALYALLEAAPDHLDVMDWGITFYERLQGRSDDDLDAGNLPRSEVEAGLNNSRRAGRSAAGKLVSG